MSAAVEVNFITDIHTQAHRTQMAFDTTARVKDAVDIATTEILDAADKGSDGGRRIVDSKVDETTFECHKWVNVVVFAKVHFRPEFSMEDAHAGLGDGDGAGGRVSEVLGKGLIEIVTDFTLELETAETHHHN